MNACTTISSGDCAKYGMEFSIFSNKIGIENIILMVVGMLHLIVFVLRFKDVRKYHRLYLHLWEGLFFLGYGFCYDLFRYKFVLQVLLVRWGFNNLLAWRMSILFFFLLPVYGTLIRDVLILILHRQTTAIDPPTN
jgi:hypothetical protein